MWYCGTADGTNTLSAGSLTRLAHYGFEPADLPPFGHMRRAMRTHSPSNSTDWGDGPKSSAVSDIQQRDKDHSKRFGMCVGEAVVVKPKTPDYRQAFIDLDGAWEDSYADYCECHGQILKIEPTNDPQTKSARAKVKLDHPVNKDLFYPTENLIREVDFKKAKKHLENYGVAKGDKIVVKGVCGAFEDAFRSVQGDWKPSYGEFSGLQGEVVGVEEMTCKSDNVTAYGKIKVALENERSLFYPHTTLMTEKVYAHKEHFGVCRFDTVMVKEDDDAFRAAFAASTYKS